jgi:hypothetical protein
VSDGTWHVDGKALAARAIFMVTMVVFNSTAF